MDEKSKNDVDDSEDVVEEESDPEESHLSLNPNRFPS